MNKWIVSYKPDGQIVAWVLLNGANARSVLKFVAGTEQVDYLSDGPPNQISQHVVGSPPRVTTK